MEVSQASTDFVPIQGYELFEVKGETIHANIFFRWHHDPVGAGFHVELAVRISVGHINRDVFRLEDPLGALHDLSRSLVRIRVVRLCQLVGYKVLGYGAAPVRRCWQRRVL